MSTQNSLFLSPPPAALVASRLVLSIDSEMYPPKEPTHFLVPIPVQPPLPLPIGMPGQFAPQLQEHLLMHVPVHRQMPMVRCPKTGEFIPIPAVPEVYHKVTYEGKPGEFHCMKCVRICDYINNIYCCDEAKNKNSQKVKLFRTTTQWTIPCFRRNVTATSFKCASSKPPWRPWSMRWSQTRRSSTRTAPASSATTRLNTAWDGAVASRLCSCIMWDFAF